MVEVVRLFTAPELRYLARQAGMRLGDVAREVGVTEPTLMKWVNNPAMMKVGTCIRITKLLQNVNQSSLEEV